MVFRPLGRKIRESGLWGFFDVDTDMKGGRRGVVEEKVLSLVHTYTKNLDLIK